MFLHKHKYQVKVFKGPIRDTNNKSYILKYKRVSCLLYLFKVFVKLYSAGIDFRRQISFKVLPTLKE